MGQKKQPRRSSRPSVNVSKGWNTQADELLERFYGKVSMSDLCAMFPGRSRNAIKRRIATLGIEAPVPTETPREVTDQDIARAFVRARSLDEAARLLRLEPDVLKTRLANGITGYSLETGPPGVLGTETFVAVPEPAVLPTLERVWRWEHAPNETPYGMVTFPDDLPHKKLRIIPIDGIAFGAEEHDSERFADVIKTIASQRNTYCILTGNTIAPIMGGKRWERDEATMQRVQAFFECIRPILPKVLWAMQGVYEERMLRTQGLDPLAFLCAQHGIPYFTEPAHVDLAWNTHVFTFWVMHGPSRAEVKGAKINPLQRSASYLSHTDFVIRAGVGDAIYNDWVRICRSPETMSLVPRSEAHITLSTFARYWGTRASRKGIPPSSQDPFVLYLFPNGAHAIKTLLEGEPRADDVRVSVLSQEPDTHPDLSRTKNKTSPAAMQAIAEFLARPRTHDEVANTFRFENEDRETVRSLPLPEQYTLFEQKTRDGKSLYVAIKQDGIERAYAYWKHVEHPYLWVQLPELAGFDRVELIGLSDVHYGAKGHNLRGFQRDIEYIRKTPNAYGFLNGDLIDNALGDSIGGAVYDQVLSPEEQIYGRQGHDPVPGIIDLLMPIRHKLILGKPGNHEWRSWKHANIDPTRIICDKLQIPYFSEPVYTDILWRGHRFTFYTHHGVSGSNTKGGKINAAVRPAGFQEAVDFVIMGHVHDAMAIPSERIERVRTQDEHGVLHPARLAMHTQHGIILPSYYKYFGTYGSRAEYAPGSWRMIKCQLMQDGNYRPVMVGR